MIKAAEIILNCLKEAKISQTKLAQRMGEDVRCLSQQLNRQKDMKVERFTDVLAYIGYRLEVVENDGAKKVSTEFAKQINETKEPKGLFWYRDGEKYIGIDNSKGDILSKEFEKEAECVSWLKTAK